MQVGSTTLNSHHTCPVKLRRLIDSVLTSLQFAHVFFCDPSSSQFAGFVTSQALQLWSSFGIALVSVYPHTLHVVVETPAVSHPGLVVTTAAPQSCPEAAIVLALILHLTKLIIFKGLPG